MKCLHLFWCASCRFFERFGFQISPVLWLNENACTCAAAVQYEFVQEMNNPTLHEPPQIETKAQIVVSHWKRILLYNKLRCRRKLRVTVGYQELIPACLITLTHADIVPHHPVRHLTFDPEIQICIISCVAYSQRR